MDEGTKSMIVFFLLFVFSGKPAEGQSLLDVCSTCHANATCDDKSDGSGKVCNCKYGFVGNGRTFCQDKDECQIGSSKICGQHTTCHNTFGSYYCTCLAGYSPSNNMAVFIPNDGTHCQDIDECGITGQCGEGAQCRNLEGSFDCSCQVGYKIHNGVEPFNPLRDKASCKVVNCGPPALLEDTVLVPVTGTTYSSVATFICDEGFVWRRGDNSSVCGAEGLWSKPDMVCEEVDCGSPPAVPHSRLLWNKSTRMGTEVVYQCNSGYHNVGKGNVSICTAAGQWAGPSVLCREILCGNPPVIEFTGQVWSYNSIPGSTVLYFCKDGFYNKGGNNVSTCQENGQWTSPTLSCQAKCGPAPFLANSEVVWHNRSVVIHRCVAGYHSWRGSNVSVCGSSREWQKATLRCIEIKPPINHLLIFNESCLQWKAEKYEEDTEVYKVTYTGSRDYQRSFYDKRKRFLSSKADQLKLCLGLLPVTNYSITITATSAKFTASVTTNTSLPVPPGPVVYYREFDTPLPTLSLRRSPNTLDLISLYQVFVLPVEGFMMFNCSSPAIALPLSTLKSPAEYITAQFEVHRVGTEMNLTIGDGLLYGGFYNAPLESGKNYYIILRAVSQWKSAFKSSCVLWAKVTATSYALRVSSLSAVATIGLVAVVIWGGYSIHWCFKKT
ncbi:sushi domain-containing protein 1 isoform X4 [Astatotilapia calliptera]|uniref:sushi domain-containing protein 1 isoform X4 n=1 Tax=Astatotilapia calliptera TaxID=8154 RepID=UPI000E3FCC64|nr:sushi domain-containing protein 1-like isoform X4 [Astatotilapia calliptera]